MSLIISNLLMVGWMSSLPESRKTSPFSTLKIPGSHDSGAHNLHVDMPLAHDQKFNKFVRQLSKTRIVRRVVKRWSETQNLDILEQLKAGVRYLDIRLELTTYKKESIEPMLVHALYGLPAKMFFEQVKTFLDTYDYEVVILDINHIYRMSPVDFVQFVVDALLAVFPIEIICPTSYDFSKTSLEDIASKGYRLVIVGPYKQAVESFIYSDLTIRNKWPNKNRINDLMNFMRLEILQPTPKRIHVLQGVITARPADIILHPFSSLRKMFSEKATASTLELISGLRDTEKEKINVVLLDQVTQPVASAIINLNTDI
ncbi:unnamed protein product [Caenorhabditis auriculariae]|uniref:Phosphatidylinositol-specific phospholipase C X domain-containing protein n=1 Tax=Caenorhabditis auriculariae TaxID=2777116 RepID=A0A8S1GQZ3_9PELO|nr:unnamed protein product [Caenorhabditis auriculariae]